MASGICKVCDKLVPIQQRTPVPASSAADLLRGYSWFPVAHENEAGVKCDGDAKPL